MLEKEDKKIDLIPDHSTVETFLITFHVFLKKKLFFK